MGLFGGLTNAIFGDPAAGANKAAKASNKINAEYLEMARQIFTAQMSAFTQMQAAGAFNPEFIRRQVQRGVDNMMTGINVSGAAAGAKTGDTKHASALARGAIRGGQALADVDYTAGMREIGALGQINVGNVGQATRNASQGYFQGGQAVDAANSARMGQFGQIAGLGMNYFGAQSAAPNFNTFTPGHRPGSFGRFG